MRREQLEAAESIVKQEASTPNLPSQPCPAGILTPPASNRKSGEIILSN